MLYGKRAATLFTGILPTITQSFVVNQVAILFYELANFQRGFFQQQQLSDRSQSSRNGVRADRSQYPLIPPNWPAIRSRSNCPMLWGRTLYNMIFNNSDTITKSAAWLKYFHGLCISPGPGSNGAIYGF